ncbi:MAG: transcriptional repressor [Eubacterium sp.]|nr:transcriptional repressor [Eubacterium sp.]
MNNKSQYKTKQRAELTAYLMSVPGKHVTAGDVCDHFAKQGRPIGLTTVYRQLDKMVAEGLVNKYNLEPGSPACYEYIDSEHHSDGHVSCYHCKCEKCGKLIHLHCEEIEELIKHLAKEHSFQIDSKRTVLYGICEDCREDN